MNKINPMLLKDFYKAVHGDMLPQNMTKSVSYFTPRMSRVKRWDKVVMFGLQGFIKTYLIDYFNEYFFSKTINWFGSNTYKIFKMTFYICSIFQNKFSFQYCRQRLTV